MNIYMIRSNWKEKQGRVIQRERLGDNYIFIHFQTPVKAYFNNDIVDVHPGGCILYERFQPQKFASPDCELVHDWFHAQSEPCAALVEQFGLQCSKIYYPADSLEINHLVREMELETLRGELFSSERCDALMQQICIALARSEARIAEEKHVLKYKEQFLQIRLELQSAIAENYKVEDMAKRANMSVSGFFSIYRQLFGVSPKKDLINARLSRAKLLLSGSDESIEHIAELSGYSNPYHFIRQFKSETGITPGKYRQNSN